MRKPIEKQLTWDFMYANNTALLAEGIASLKLHSNSFEPVYCVKGKTVSSSKTIILVIGTHRGHKIVQ